MVKAITIQNKYKGYTSQNPLGINGDIKIDIFQNGKKVNTIDTRKGDEFLKCGDNLYGTLEHLAALQDNKKVISQKDIEKAGNNKGILKRKHNIENVIFNPEDPTKITIVYKGKSRTTVTIDIENKGEKDARIAKEKKAAAKRVANCLNNMGITPPSWLPVK